MFSHYFLELEVRHRQEEAVARARRNRLHAMVVANDRHRGAPLALRAAGWLRALAVLLESHAAARESR